MFASVYIKGNQMKLFQKDVASFIAAYITKLRFTVLTAGWSQTTAFQNALYLHNALYTMHAGETIHCKPCYNAT